MYTYTLYNIIAYNNNNNNDSQLLISDKDPYLFLPCLFYVSPNNFWFNLPSLSQYAALISASIFTMI